MESRADYVRRGIKRDLHESTSGPAVATGAGDQSRGRGPERQPTHTTTKPADGLSRASARRSKRARRPTASDFGIGMDAEEQLQLRLALEKSIVQTVRMPVLCQW